MSKKRVITLDGFACDEHRGDYDAACPRCEAAAEAGIPLVKDLDWTTSLLELVLSLHRDGYGLRPGELKEIEEAIASARKKLEGVTASGE